MKSIRVLNIISSLRTGGAEQCVVNFTDAALGAGVDAHIVVLNPMGLDKRSDQIRKICYVLEKESVYWAPLLILRYMRSFSNSQPTIIIASFWPLLMVSVLVKLLARSQSIKVVFWEHHWNSKYNIVSKMILRAAFHWVDYVIGWRRSWMPLKGLISGKVRFMDTGNPVKFPKESCLPKRSSNSPFKVFTCARLVPQKRILETVYAFILSEIFDRSTLTIIGDGPLYSMLRSLIDDLQLSNVFLIGSISDPVEIFGTYDLCVIMSSEEGFCNVVVESLASGTPVLTVANGSVAEDLIRGPDCGLVLRAGSIEDFSSALASQARSSERASSCKVVLEMYSSEIWTRRVLDDISKGGL